MLRTSSRRPRYCNRISEVYLTCPPQFQHFRRVWPTSQTYLYHKFMDPVPYAEKLMGKVPALVFSRILWSLSDAYEHHFSQQRGLGVEMVRSFCREGKHLRVPGKFVDKFALSELMLKLTGGKQ